MYDLKETKPGNYRATSTQHIEKGLSVNLIIDYEQEKQTLEFVKKIDIPIQIVAFANKPITAKFKLDKDYLLEGELCQPAINRALTNEEIAQNFAKSEYFNAKLNIKTENAFLPKQQLNEFRRNVYDKIYAIKTKNDKQHLQKTRVQINLPVKKFNNFEFVDNANFSSSFQNIIYSPEIYTIKNVLNFVNNCKAQNKIPILDTPNFALKEDIDLLQKIIDETNITILVNNYYAMSLKANKIIGAGLNIYNSVSANFFNLPCITAESDISTRINFPYMTLRHCPIKQNLKTDCKNCKYNTNYKFKIENGKILTLKRKKLSTCTFYLT